MAPTKNALASEKEVGPLSGTGRKYIILIISNGPTCAPTDQQINKKLANTGDQIERLPGGTL